MQATPRPMPAIGGLALAVVLAACGGRAPSPAAGVTTTRARTAVVTAAVEHGAGEGTLPVPGVVQARQRATLAARIPASVTELPWREGDRVASGALVARLDDVALRAALAAAEAAAASAESDRRRVEALLGKGAATPRESEESRARAAAAAAGVASARDHLAWAAVRAPFGGTIASRPVNVGDVVSPGTTLIEIEGGGGLEVRASAEAERVRGLRKGTAVAAIVDGQPGPLTATVSAVSAAGDAATHRFEVRADLPPAPGLRSGLFVRLLLPAVGGERRLVVPAGAVFERGGLSGVFVVAEGTARLRWVAAGATSGTLRELRAGVEVGERVALQPERLTDGQPVAESAGRSR